MSAPEDVRRVLVLVPWLAAHRGVTKDEVCERFGITRAQLDKHFQLWAKAGAPDDGTAYVRESRKQAARPPIGTPESLERARRDQLVRFYRDWYRPDLMAVVVVFSFAAGVVFLLRGASGAQGPGRPVDRAGAPDAKRTDDEDIRPEVRDGRTQQDHDRQAVILEDPPPQPAHDFPLAGPPPDRPAGAPRAPPAS